MRQRTCVYYDDQCGFCQALAGYAERKTQSHRVAFLPLALLQQEENSSVTGGAKQPHASVVVLKRTEQDKPGPPESMYRSQAVLHVFTLMGGWWKMLAAVLNLLPRPLLDFGYRTVARLRYFSRQRANSRIMRDGQLKD
jgi:predicted DCC family thiol-disulfide oxidoreductase YuxK